MLAHLNCQPFDDLLQIHGRLGELVLSGRVFEFPAKSIDPVLCEDEAPEDGHDALDAVLLEEHVGHVDGVHRELLDPFVHSLDEPVLGFKGNQLLAKRFAVLFFRDVLSESP